MSPLGNLKVWCAVWLVLAGCSPAVLAPSGPGGPWNAPPEEPEVLAQTRPPPPSRGPSVRAPGRSSGRGGRGREQRTEPVFNAEPSPAQREVTRRQAETAALARTLQARYRALLSEAQKLYPEKASRYEEHHFWPLYLGGPTNGTTYRIPASYHQLLTNAFRAQHPYGSPRPSEQRAREIMLKVYSQFPIPQLIGIPNP